MIFPHIPVRWTVPYLLAFVLVRLPFLGAGYGADTDSYRVILSARVLWSTGEYLPSRLPGFPLYELLIALVAWGGPWLTNGVSVIAALGGVVVFDRIVLALGVPQRRWLLVAMGFTPWLIITSTITQDYQVALTAMLGAYLAVLRRRPVLAGALLGVATGTRLTAAALIVPLLLIGSSSKLRGPSSKLGVRRNLELGTWNLELIAAWAVVSALAYLPVWWTYGPRLWNYAASSVSPDVVIQMVGQRALGAVGALVTLGVLASSWRRLGRLPSVARRDPQVLAWLVAVAIYGLLFLRLPVDVGYLVPVYPFAFLLLARVLSRWALPLVVCATMLSGMIDLDIQRLHNFSPASAVREVRPSWRVANLPNEYIARTRWRDYAERIVAEPVPPHSVVLTGGAFPVVAVTAWDRLRYEIVERDLGAVSMISDNGALWDEARDVVYLAVSEPRIVQRFRTDRYAVYRAEPVGRAWRARLVPMP